MKQNFHNTQHLSPDFRVFKQIVDVRGCDDSRSNGSSSCFYFSIFMFSLYLCLNPTRSGSDLRPGEQLQTRVRLQTRCSQDRNPHHGWEVPGWCHTPRAEPEGCWDRTVCHRYDSKCSTHHRLLLCYNQLVDSKHRAQWYFYICLYVLRWCSSFDSLSFI